MKKTIFKKSATLLLSLSCILNTGVAFADEEITSGRIRGIMTAGNILSFAYDSGDASYEDIASYEWYQSTSEGGEYKLYSTDAECQSQCSIVAAENLDYWYKVKVTFKNGETYTTAPAKVDKMYRTCYCANGVKWQPAGTLENSNPDYTFEVDGQKFVLLDTVASSDKSRFMVIADQTYGIEEFPLDKYVTNMGKIKALLPQAIKDGIKQSVYFEGSPNQWGTWTGGWFYDIFVPSANEMNIYKDIIGMKVSKYNDTSNTPVIFALRSAHNEFAIGLGWKNNGVTAVHNLRNRAVWDDIDQGEIRPLFYLDKEFFKNGAINLETVGGKVAEIIRESYTREELLTVYSQKQLEEYLGFEPDFKINSIATDETSGNISVNLSNNYGKGTEGVLITLYNADNELVGCVLADMSVGKGNTGAVTVSMEELKTVGSGSVRAFVVGGSTGMSALTLQYSQQIE